MGDGGKGKVEKNAVVKKYEFLEDEESGIPTVIKKWEGKQVEDEKHAKDHLMSTLRTASLLAMNAMQTTPLTSKDILIVGRELPTSTGSSQPTKKDHRGVDVKSV